MSISGYFHHTVLVLAVLTLSHCGPKQVEPKTVDPNYIEDGGFAYSFGVPEDFKVSVADLGATISYAPNDTVKSYSLYMGTTEALEGIPQASAQGIDSPMNVNKANIIRLNSGSLSVGTEYFFAVEAFNNKGESSGLTEVKSITVRDLIGMEVQYKARLFACVSGKSITQFEFSQGKMKLALSTDDEANDTTQGRFPGQGEEKCHFEGVKLELQKIEKGAPTGPLYRFPPDADGKKIFTGLDQSIELSVSDSHSDFANMVTSEPMTIGLDGELKKFCQSGFSKYRVKARDAGNGVAEEDDPIDTIEIDTSKCGKNNWTTFHPTYDNVIEFNLFFQTTE